MNPLTLAAIIASTHSGRTILAEEIEEKVISCPEKKIIFTPKEIAEMKTLHGRAKKDFVKKCREEHLESRNR